MRTFTAALILSLVLLPSAAVSGQQPTPKPTPTPAPAPATPAAAAPAEDTRSLFEPTSRQFQIGGRLSSVEGDPARWQRYRDLRDGLLFTNARYEREWAETGQRFQVAADNVGWRDGRYLGMLERAGRFTVTGSWDRIPQFYSVDTKTPYTANGATLTLDDATQRSIQNAQATLSAYVPQAPQFDLVERRDTGIVGASINATKQLQLTTSFKTQKHVGELPWGASFGFSNDVEVALPYTSRTNDFNMGAEWSNQRNMLRVAYDGSWFTNNDDTLVWDSPLRIDDSRLLPGRGRMSLWPSNQAQTISVGGSSKLARRTQLTGFVSYGLWSNDSELQPFTINSQLPVIALPRQIAEAEAHVFSTNIGIVSRPADEWRVTARLRTYNFDNQMPATTITDYVSYDSSVKHLAYEWAVCVSRTTRGTLTADATWTGLKAVALGAGYTRQPQRLRAPDLRGHRRRRVHADGGCRDAALGQRASAGRVLRPHRLGAGRSLARADRRTAKAQTLRRRQPAAPQVHRTARPVPDRDVWRLSVNAGVGKDEYDDSYFGLQESSFRVAGVALDFQRPNGLGAGASYSYERYAGFQVSRSAGSDVEAADPARDWTTDSSENVHYFSLFLTPPRMGRNTEARLVYDYSDARANYVYGIAPGSPLVPPNQLPEAYNTLQELRAELRHRLSSRLAATVSYAFEKFRVYDFAMDPSVVDGIVQPSSLVLGYVYRPYTTHSAVVSLLYFW